MIVRSHEADRYAASPPKDLRAALQRMLDSKKKRGAVKKLRSNEW